MSKNESDNFQKIEEKVEKWLTDEKVGFQKVEDGFWALSFNVKEKNEEYPLGIVLVGEEPVSVRVLVELGSVPPGDQWAFFRKMLELNFSGVIRGAFAINDINNKVYFLDRIAIESLTKERLLASLDAVIYSASELKPKLSGYVI